jgi:hypothetical protein
MTRISETAVSPTDRPCELSLRDEEEETKAEAILWPWSQFLTAKVMYNITGINFNGHTVNTWQNTKIIVTKT